MRMANGRFPSPQLAVHAGSSAVLCCRRRISHYLIEQGGDGQMTPLLRLGAGACAGIVGRPRSPLPQQLFLRALRCIMRDHFDFHLYLKLCEGAFKLLHSKVSRHWSLCCTCPERL